MIKTKLAAVIAVIMVILLCGCSFKPPYDDTTEMPEPFAVEQETGGDHNREFYSVVNMKLNYIDNSLSKYVGYDNFDEWLYSTSSSLSDYTAIDEVANLYSLIVYFDIPDDAVRELLGALQLGYEDELTDDEIELLISRDNEAIAEHFAHEHAIRKGENLYSLCWIYSHSISDYIANGITAQDIQEKMPYFESVGIQQSAKEAIKTKIDAYASGNYTCN